MKVGIIGAGRIGKVHAKNISMFVPEMEIKTIADPFMNKQTEAFAKSCGIPNTTKDANDILNDPEIDALIDQATATADATEREAITSEICAKLNVICTQVPLYQPLNLRAYNANLENVEINGAGDVRIENFSWKE